MRTRLFVATLCCLVAASSLAADEPTAANQPPEGFVALFNGKDLAGWIGVPHFDPRKLRAMTPDERAAYLEKNWSEVEKHWSVDNGELVNDGHGPYLTTGKDYGDFELRLEYKTVAKADSGIYLRGMPQVQIWDSTEGGPSFARGADKGSGGLFNNQKTPNSPLVHADKPFGEWNSFRITMVGDSVTVFYNDKLVVNEQPLENYWDRESPEFPVGPVQLQTHGGEIRFRNVFLREIPRKPPEAGHLSQEGTPYGDGWIDVSEVDLNQAGDTVSLRNFELHATFRFEDGQPAELAVRAGGGDDGPALVLTASPEQGVILSERKNGAPYAIASIPAEASGLKSDDVNHVYLRIHEDHIQAWLNGTPNIDVLYPHGPSAGAIRHSGATVTSAFVREGGADVRTETFSGGEEGFEPIFNGRDLTGWTGDVNGYAAEPNVLKSKPKAGGNLFYEQELSNFVFRFEFKLNEGGNNGVGIRIPKGASATAYEGVESQILDNTSEQYATIKPWQTHGSIYGVVPAKRGYLAPTGHWNQQEITVDGSRFKVVLNGKTIVDADVKSAAGNGTVDGREHPGLSNTTGLLGFLGHGHEIEFRNLRVKRLNAD